MAQFFKRISNLSNHIRSRCHSQIPRLHQPHSNTHYHHTSRSNLLLFAPITALSGFTLGSVRCFHFILDSDSNLKFHLISDFLFISNQSKSMKFLLISVFRLFIEFPVINRLKSLRTTIPMINEMALNIVDHDVADNDRIKTRNSVSR